MDVYNIVCRARSPAIFDSMDSRRHKYAVEIRVQDLGQNEKVIQDMKRVVKKLLKKFLVMTRPLSCSETV